MIIMSIRIDYSSFPDRERKSAFTNKLIPESPLKSAGVSVPHLREIARTISSDDIEIVYIEDVVIKGICIFSRKESFDEKKEKIESFLPLLCSWMVTDIVSSSLYYRKSDEEKVYSYFLSLIDREEEMTRRLGIIALMKRQFMEGEKGDEILSKLVRIHTDHYLLQMAIAWYFATSYTYFPEKTLPYFRKLDIPIQKKARSKCRDSRRISKERKEKLDELLTLPSCQNDPDNPS